MTDNRPRVKTGKGDKWRKNTDMKAYWEADIWKKMGKKSKSRK